LQCIPSEHILIDGASTDATREIITKQSNYFAHITSEPDDGIYDAMNKGLQVATGDIIGILNSDDFYPDKFVLEKVSKIFADQSISACYGDLLYVDNKNKSKVVRYWKSSSFKPSKFYWGWMPPHPTFFVRSSVYKQFGLFNVKLGTAADYELMIRLLLKQEIKVAYIPEILVHMRTGGISNKSILNRLKANKMDRLAWEVNNIRPYPWTMYLKPIRKLQQWTNVVTPNIT